MLALEFSPAAAGLAIGDLPSRGDTAYFSTSAACVELQMRVVCFFQQFAESEQGASRLPVTILLTILRPIGVVVRSTVHLLHMGEDLRDDAGRTGVTQAYKAFARKGPGRCELDVKAPEEEVAANVDHESVTNPFQPFDHRSAKLQVVIFQRQL